MVIDKNISYELNYDYEKLINNYYGKWLVVCSSASFDMVLVDDECGDNYEKQCVESLHFVVAICDTEDEAINYLKTTVNGYSEFSSREYYAFCLNPNPEDMPSAPEDVQELTELSSLVDSSGDWHCNNHFCEFYDLPF